MTTAAQLAEYLKMQIPIDYSATAERGQTTTGSEVVRVVIGGTAFTITICPTRSKKP